MFWYIQIFASAAANIALIVQRAKIVTESFADSKRVYYLEEEHMTRKAEWRKMVMAAISGIICLLLLYSNIGIKGLAEDQYPIKKIETYIAEASFKKDDETREYPYEASALKISFKKGDKIQIVAKVTNQYDNLWYETVEGYYAYSGDVEIQWEKVSDIGAYYSFTKNDELRKEPFEASAISVNCKEEDMYYVTYSVKNKLGNVWYSTVSGFAYSGDMKYCCKELWVDRVVVKCDSAQYSYKLPYDSSSKVNQYSKGSYVKVVKGVANKVSLGIEHTWYQVEGSNGFIYSGDVTIMYRLVSPKKGMYKTLASTSLYEGPFAEGSTKSIAAGTEIEIIDAAVNNKGESWCLIKTTDAKKWIMADKIKYIGTVSITITSTGATSGIPSGDLKKGTSFYIKGTIKASDNITTVVGAVYNTVTGQEAQSTITVSPQAKTLDLYSSNINKKIYFSKLPVGSYRLVITATLSTGYTKELVNSQFNIVETVCTHTKTTEVIKQEAQCETKGIKQFVCSSCGQVVKTEDIPATGHKPVVDAAVEAGCTTEGKTEGSHCSVCGKVITAQTTIAALGHNPGDWVVVTKPTATTSGLKQKKCTRCDAVLESEEIPPTGGGDDIDPPSVKTINAKKGETVTLGVYVNAQNASMITLKCNWDTKVFEFVSSECFDGQSSNGTFSIYSLTNTISGKIGTITLKLKNDIAEGTYKLTVNVTEAYDIDETPVPCKAAADIVKVSTRIPGDVTGDGSVDGRDLLRLAKYLGGYDVTIVAENATVNGDSAVDGRDLLRLAKYLGGYSVELQ